MKKTALLLAILIFIVPFADAASMKKSVDVVLYPITFFFDGEEANTQKQGEFFNGKEYVPLAMIHKGTTYVPLRFVGEKLGKEVGWDPDTYSIWVGQKPEALGTAQTTEPKTELSGLYGLYIGQSAADVKQQRGEPDRVDLSPLGYEWWIYNADPARYVQVGVRNGVVVDLYSNADTWTLKGVRVGSTPSRVKEAFSPRDTVSFSFQNAEFTVENEENERTLVMWNEVPVIFYHDIFEDRVVTAVRLLSKENLVKAKMFSMSYSYFQSPPNLEVPVLTEAQQERVNRSMERQIFDLTNVIRKRKGLSILTWNEKAAEVARGHSLDMQDGDFFSHVSATTGSTFSERLQRGGLELKYAGENIAMGQYDGIEAHEAWMNSEGHRNNILSPNFQTLGVGVIRHYYTQNFVTEH